MTQIKFFFLFFIFLGCNGRKDFTPGIYHFESLPEATELVTQTIRFEADSTFTLFGVSKHKILGDSISYGRYVTFGNWVKHDGLVIINSKISENKAPKQILLESDMKFVDHKPWDFSELVLNIEEDTFLIMGNGDYIYSLKQKIFLDRQ